MQRAVALLIAVVSGFAVIVQFIIMLQNRTAPVPETIIRFFSFFTILTNIIVGAFFTGRLFKAGITDKPGNLTAVTVYIFIVCIVYQFLLRHLFEFQGWQWFVDELLHTVNPLLVVLYWFRYEKKAAVTYSHMKTWLIYPLVYLAYIFIRGAMSGFYPYPFVDAKTIGLARALLNGGSILLFAIIVAAAFVFIGKKTSGNVKM